MANVDVKFFEDEPKSTNVGLLIVVTSIFLTVVVIFSYFLFISMLSQDKDLKQSFVKTPRIDELNQEYDFRLNELRWIDKDNGFVKVPIDVGMQYVIKRYN
jgi:hypothetical protein